MCRAAFGALASCAERAFHVAMAAHRQKGERKQAPSVAPRSPRRRPLRLQEVLLAAFLTAAAIGFIAAAILRGEWGTPQTPSVEAERKPFSEMPP
jgi:hypothetical protein